MTDLEKLCLSLYRLNEANPNMVTYWFRRLAEQIAQDESGRKTPRKVVNRCTSMRTPEDGFSGSPQVPCQGVFYDDGTTENTCGEPCRWIMQKSGEGDPPYGDYRGRNNC